jgi:hypothetical protein
MSPVERRKQPPHGAFLIAINKEVNIDYFTRWINDLKGQVACPA